MFESQLFFLICFRGGRTSGGGVGGWLCVQEEEWEGEWEGDYVYGRGEGGGGMGNYTIFVTTVIFKLAIVIYNRYNEYCQNATF